jgi:hypothetical protein
MRKLRPHTRCKRCGGKIADNGGVGHEEWLCLICTEQEAFVVIENVKGQRKSVAWLLRKYAQLLDRSVVSDHANDQQ